MMDRYQYEDDRRRTGQVMSSHSYHDPAYEDRRMAHEGFRHSGDDGMWNNNDDWRRWRCSDADRQSRRQQDINAAASSSSSFLPLSNIRQGRDKVLDDDDNDDEEEEEEEEGYTTVFRHGGEDDQDESDNEDDEEEDEGEDSEDEE